MTQEKKLKLDMIRSLVGLIASILYFMYSIARQQNYSVSVVLVVGTGIYYLMNSIKYKKYLKSIEDEEKNNK